MARVISIVLLCLLGLARGAGGIHLALRGPDTVESAVAGIATARALGIGLIFVGVLALIAAVGLQGRRTWAPWLSIMVPLLFVLDGVMNGLLLFGGPGMGGTVVNVVVAAAIVGVVLLAKTRGELSGPA